MVLLTVFVVLSHLCAVLSFNLDQRIPIIKSAGAFADSYFGYSVAQHRTGSSSIYSRDGGEATILVGAPRDQNLQPGTNRSGALWRCSLSSEIRVRPVFPVLNFALFSERGNKSDAVQKCVRDEGVAKTIFHLDDSATELEKERL